MSQELQTQLKTLGKSLGADAVFSTVTDFCTFDEVRGNAKENLRRAAKSIAAVLAVGTKQV